MNAKVVRSIREPLKKPRPLKTQVSVEQTKFQIPEPKDSVFQKSRDEILADLEILNVSISNCSFDPVTTMDISRMCAILKKRGEELDSYHKDAIDRFFCTLRNACREEKLDMISRVKLLETIELRARAWKQNENINNYFNVKIMELKQKFADNYSSGVTSPAISYPMQNQNISTIPGVPLAPGEILRSSGKFEKPAKIAGKNCFKDEILIRNSDSGKVNPGARDRLVQITGPHEEAIGHAKLLVEDTIRRNASPVRDSGDFSGFENNVDPVDFNNSFTPLDNQIYMKKNLQHSVSMSDASLKEFTFSLQVGQDYITLNGTNADLLKTARLVLKEYFTGQLEVDEKHESVNRQSSSESSIHGYDLKRQSSLRTTRSNNYPSSMSNHSLRRDSISPFSSSDDDFVRDEIRNGIGRARVIKDLPSHNSVGSRADVKTHNFEPFVSHTHQGKFIRSSSVPNEPLPTPFPNFEPVHSDEVFSPLMSPSDSEMPPIPPPSYKKQKYSRDFLLQCARSPFSHTQPANYALIHQNIREIICKSPVMFDPVQYEEFRSRRRSNSN